VLDPWPAAVRHVKLGSEGAAAHKGFDDAFELKHSVIKLFDYVRAVDHGEIIRLEVRWGIPFLMEVLYRPT
jgi:hypothetical protein